MGSTRELHDVVDPIDPIEHSHRVARMQSKHAIDLAPLLRREENGIVPHLFSAYQKPVPHGLRTTSATQSCSWSVRTCCQPASRNTLMSSSARSSRTPDRTATPPGRS